MWPQPTSRAEASLNAAKPSRSVSRAEYNDACVHVRRVTPELGLGNPGEA